MSEKKKKKAVNFSKKMPLVLAQYDGHNMMQEFWSEIICYAGRLIKWSLLTGHLQNLI